MTTKAWCTMSVGRVALRSAALPKYMRHDHGSVRHMYANEKLTAQYAAAEKYGWRSAAWSGAASRPSAISSMIINT